MAYDAAGNLTNDTYTGAGNRTYDAENKITSAWGGNNQAQLYSYDASGQRIKRTIDGVETWQVYGFGGELLAEYGADADPLSPQKEYGYRNGQLLITAEITASQSPPLGINLAAASNGAVATASSTYPTVVAGHANNGDHVGAAGWWADDTSNSYPDWIQIEFSGSKTISEIDVYGVQQNYSSPVEPTATMTSGYALTNFEVQYWTGSAWATVPGGSVTGNDKVWRRFTFASLTTSKIRVHVTNVAGDNHSNVVEIEAYGRANVAAASNGAVATASSTYPTVVAGHANNGDHVGTASWWADDTSNSYPDWIQVEFAGSKTIGEIDVFGVQQNYSSPVEPTATMTSSYALTNFEVQYWTGSAWATVPEGSVTGNDKVWRKFTFAPLTTTKIRVHVTYVAGDNHSNVVELEAYTASASAATIQWLVSDHLGTSRMIFDQTGDLAKVKRHDYLPFGEELFAGTGGRSEANGYGCPSGQQGCTGDQVRQQFTAQERDVETGLDYFGARYYGSLSGRFTSADPLMASGRVSLPQSWNRYSYVLNSPLNLNDPTGLADDDPQDPKKNPQTVQPRPTETPLPIVTVATSKDPRATNGTEPRANVSLEDGTYATGVIAPLTITVTDASGKPLSGLTITETNKLIEAEPALPFKENPKTVTTDSTGSFPDIVFGNATITSEPVSSKEAEEIINNQVESRVRVVTEQTLTISAPGQGVIATAVYQRTITNLKDGRLTPPTNRSGRHVNNFRVSVTSVTVSGPNSP